jgi:para-aminobenzoate synthetase / 4-amino-4-deoxychorismate lyase
MKIENILASVIRNPHSAFFYTPPIYKNSSSYIFSYPVKKLIFNQDENLEVFFTKADSTIRKYKYGYALIKYELGYILEKRLSELVCETQKDIIQLFFFNNLKKLDSNNINFPRSDKRSYKISNFMLNSNKKEYENNIKKIKGYIEKGDTYQVNYTVKGRFKFSGSLISLFTSLIFNQSAEFSAFINNGDKIIISLSPELFFSIAANTISSKPMKGTIRRGENSSEDSFLLNELQESKKDKAENSMIVDLIRNDIGKISRFNSINVDRLFSIEKYESLFQMTSLINGKLKKGIEFSDVIKAIFPCGSVTGAPKLRTMQIIHEIEKEKRGIYTGAIGVFNKKEIVFNVPIRTLILDKKKNIGEVGLGSGIVWDSNAGEEFREVMLKSKFLTKPLKYFELFETILIRDKKAFLLNQHLNRLKESAGYFLFVFDEERIKVSLNKRLNHLLSNRNYRCRISLNKWGKFKIQITPYSERKERGKIIISRKRISSKNPFQYFKTTSRDLYNEQFSYYSSKGFFDIIFLNENDEVTEGAISNIFLRKNDTIFTSPIESGILNGIYRQYYIQRNPKVIEKKLFVNDLLDADEVFLTNSLRGKTHISKLYLNLRKFKEYS